MRNELTPDCGRCADNRRAARLSHRRNGAACAPASSEVLVKHHFRYAARQILVTFWPADHRDHANKRTPWTEAKPCTRSLGVVNPSPFMDRWTGPGPEGHLSIRNLKNHKRRWRPTRHCRLSQPSPSGSTPYLSLAAAATWLRTRRGPSLGGHRSPGSHEHRLPAVPQCGREATSLTGQAPVFGRIGQLSKYIELFAGKHFLGSLPDPTHGELGFNQAPSLSNEAYEVLAADFVLSSPVAQAPPYLEGLVTILPRADAMVGCFNEFVYPVHV